MSTCAPCRGSFTKILVAVMVAALLVELHFNLLADLKRRTLKESSNLVRLFGVHPGQSWSARRRYTWNESWTETEVTPAPRNLCPLVPPNLAGPRKVLVSAPSYPEMEKMFTNIQRGGRCKPTNCTARQRVAVIVAYRHREEHLQVFLYNMHQILPKHEIDYGIFVVEQEGEGPFNRAKLFNVGYLEALKLYNYDCFIFHDVDHIPEDDRNLYTCSEMPKHLGVYLNTRYYRLPYVLFFGGVSALSKRQMIIVNGFSNEYWGWGGEDDDMAFRILEHKLNITRPPANVARYTMLSHKKEVPSPKRLTLLKERKKRYATDGINSIKYECVGIVYKRLYTHIVADLKDNATEAAAKTG